MKHIIGITPAFSIFAWLPIMPVGIRRGIIMAVILIFMDTLTGKIAAAACRELSSVRARTKLALKLCQLSVIFTLGYVGAVLADAWFICSLGLIAIYAVEAESMIENLIGFQKYSGVSLGPADAFLRLASVYFQTERTSDSTTFSQATTIPANQSSPIIQVTTIDRIGKIDSTETPTSGVGTDVH